MLVTKKNSKRKNAMGLSIKRIGFEKLVELKERDRFFRFGRKYLKFFWSPARQLDESSLRRTRVPYFHYSAIRDQTAALLLLLLIPRNLKS